MSFTKIARLALTLIAASLLWADAAAANTYDFVDTNPAGSGLWAPSNPGEPNIAAYNEGPYLFVRNVIGDFRTGPNVAKGFTISAPSGLTFSGLKLEGAFQSGESWQAYLNTNGGDYIACGPTCIAKFPNPVTVAGFGVICRDGNGCPNSGLNGGGDPRANAYMQRATVTVDDSAGPAAKITGGNGTTEWVGGTKTVTVAASDNTGIRELVPVVDGTPQPTTARSLPCSFDRPFPCAQAPSADVTVDYSKLPAGAHTVAVAVRDTAANQTVTATKTVKVDNTPPAAPGGLGVVDGPVWRSANSFSIAWTNPEQAATAAPIAGARYRICPVGQPSSSACVERSASGAGIGRIDGLSVPAPGAWTVRVWLVDAAGNALVDTAAPVDVGFDDSAPTITVAAIDPNDPARVRATVADAESPTSGGAIEVRRSGSSTWRRLSTTAAGAGGLTAVIPDRRLRKGTYQVRATATNAAGLGAFGSRAALTKLPIRLASRLSGGRPAGKRLLRVTSPKIGKRIKLRGRLTVRGKPLRKRRIVVLERTAVEGAKFADSGARVTTDKRGRYTVRLPAGPARTVRLVYGGGTRIADDFADVQVRVRSRIDLRASPSRIRNGEYVVFRGRVRGGTIPPDGVQTVLEVRTRGKWRPARTQATNATGRLVVRYRFETVLGRAKFKFRVRILKGATYPFFGQSRTRSVVVRGLRG